MYVIRILITLSKNYKNNVFFLPNVVPFMHSPVEYTDCISA